MVIMNFFTRNTYPARIQPVQGFTLPVLFRLFREHSWRKNYLNLKKLSYLFFMSLILTPLSWREKRLFNKQVKQTEIKEDPIFIIGHWRSGTTHLHNLLIRNTNFTYVRNYQSIFAPCFLLPRVRRFARRLNKHIQLDTRPMDNIPFGTQEPWEDEFILAALTGRSPLIRTMFPQHYAQKGYDYNDAEKPEDISIWYNHFLYLIRRLTYLEDKQVLLKSPTHTARINRLLHIFPNAKFIFIVRNPYNVYKSNEILWNYAYALSHFQPINNNNIMEYIFSTYEHVHDKYLDEKVNIPDGNLIEVKYEELDSDPEAIVSRIYNKFNITFDRSEYKELIGYLEEIKNYKKNIYTIDADLKNKIYDRWQKYFSHFDYNPN